MIRTPNLTRQIAGKQASPLTRRSLIAGAGASALILAGPSLALAESHSGDDVTKQINDLIQDLAPKGDTSGGGLPIGGPKTRKVTVTLPDGTTKIYYVDYDSSASLSVEFRTDSAVISARSGQLLRVLASALKSEKLSNYSYMLAGHTDARASKAYNQGLSERRALSVSKHLQTAQGINGQRLLPVGFGENQLLNKKSPNSRVNRRVEVGLIVRPPEGAEENTTNEGGTNDLIGD